MYSLQLADIVEDIGYRFKMTSYPRDKSVASFVQAYDTKPIFVHRCKGTPGSSVSILVIQRLQGLEGTRTISVCSASCAVHVFRKRLKTEVPSQSTYRYRLITLNP